MATQTQPLISVIVPAYNLEKLLGRCLDSLLAQDFADWECLVVNDGSTDGTAAVCDAYAAKDKRFKAIHQPNGGVSAARNTGLLQIQGDYILFLDGDDTLRPFALRWLATQQMHYPGDLIGFRLCGVEEPVDDPSFDFEPRLFAAAQERAYLATAVASNVTNKLFHKSVVVSGNCEFTPGLARGEDLDFCSRYFASFFRQHPHAAVRQYSIRLYVVHNDNAEHRASNQPITAHAIDWDPQQSRGYAARLMREYADILASMGGWSGFDAIERLHFAHQYCRRFAFAVWAAGQLGEALPQGFWDDQAVGGLTTAMKQYRLYCAYYWPLRLKWVRLIRAVYHSDESESKRLYWRVFLLGDIALGRRWSRL